MYNTEMKTVCTLSHCLQNFTFTTATHITECLANK